jgi:EH domain-containing protein 1
MYRENYINSLRNELLEMVAEYLTPVAMRYGYSEVPLETNIKWRPLVLVLGNYSSGKSTMINEFLGIKVQASGQAPTDDSFTIITYDDNQPPNAPVKITEERDGKFLLNDPEYPFETLKKHGQRFAAHFRLKKVNAPFLKNLAIIDTPGMLDSITERDRGYNYQEVIGEFAQIADLVLVLFDPHKAGTVREAHTSLRHTLPSRTFEDRVLYVLNRIDECASLNDLIRVFGTLCWNLSQITGRKDIPPIHLTYSPKAAAATTETTGQNIPFLKHLENQREELKKAILQAPCHRLDNLASFVETHGERLSHFLEAMISYRKNAHTFYFKYSLTGLLITLIAAGGTFLGTMVAGPFAGMDPIIQMSIGGASGGLILILWLIFFRSFFYGRFHRNQMDHLDNLTPLENQTRRDCWAAIRDLVQNNLIKRNGKFSYRQLRQEYTAILKVYKQGSKEIREALKELAGLELDQSEPEEETPQESDINFVLKNNSPDEPLPSM